MKREKRRKRRTRRRRRKRRTCSNPGDRGVFQESWRLRISYKD